jgi:hypothetical protein
VEERITADWRSGSFVLTQAIATNNKSKEVDDVYTNITEQELRLMNGRNGE